MALDKTKSSREEKEAEMESLLRSVKNSTQEVQRRLGEVEMVRHEDYGELALDAKVPEMLRSLVPLGLMHVTSCSTTK